MESHFVFLHSMCQLLITANVVPSSPIIITLMMKVLSSSEMSVLTRATGRNIPEDAILHSHRRENLKSYISKFCFKHEQCNIHWSTLYCYGLCPYLMQFIVCWMNFLHGCLICVMIVSCALYVFDVFQHWLEHLSDD
jgi:hypothetical protein